MQNVYSARMILETPLEAICSLIPADCFHSVMFENGEVLENCTQAETEYTRWFWNILAMYPKTRIMPAHHVNKVLRGGKDALTTSTHARLSTAILKSVVDDNNLLLPIQKEPLLELIYETISDVMGFLSIRTEEHVVSLDIVDFVQIAHHPAVVAMKNLAIENPEKIPLAYETILKEIENNKDFDNNGLAKAVRSRMVKINQVMQCIAFRGFPTEVDGTTFKHPVWSNYLDGMNKVYDLVTDSRTAAKSHFYADSALRDSEYRARTLQLNAVVLERVRYEDCGSTTLMPWKVQGKRFDTHGAETYPGDLPMMLGKYYKVAQDGEWAIIEGDEKHLVGKTIWIRTSLGCLTPNPHEVCHICAGRLTQNVSRFANLGHLGSVTLSKDFTQNILSIKHVNMSSVLLRLTVGEFEGRYLNTGNRGEGYYLNKPAKDTRLLLTILSDEAPGLLEIDTNGKDTSYLQLSLSRISSISQICLTIIKTTKGVERQESVPLTVRVKQNNPMMTYELLGYLAKKGWSVDEDNNFVFDMSEWDFSDPVLVMQGKEESFVDLAAEVKRMIQSSQEHHKKRIQENAATVLLQDLFDVVNRKLRINILSMEIIVYSLMTESPTSYGLARGSKTAVLGLGDNLTMHRSLGSAMAYQGHETTIFEPAYFYAGRRPSNLMDVFLCPAEVVAKSKADRN